MTNVKDIIGDQISYADSSYDALKDVDALLIATEWSAFRNPDFVKMEQLMKDAIIFDGRNLYDLESMNSRPFFYQSIGRAIVNNKKGEKGTNYGCSWIFGFTSFGTFS